MAMLGYPVHDRRWARIWYRAVVLNLFLYHASLKQLAFVSSPPDFK